MTVELYILDGYIPVWGVGLTAWLRWFKMSDPIRLVGHAIIGRYTVLTVFTGMDYQTASGPPRLFQTITSISANEYGLEQIIDTIHYSTWEQAEGGHQRIVEKLGEEDRGIPDVFIKAWE